MSLSLDNRPFPSSLVPLFQLNESKCETSFIKMRFCMQFHFHANPSHFHRNGFALRLVLKQGNKGTRKWPIVKKQKRDQVRDIRQNQEHIRGEPLSPILDLGVNPFPSRSIKRTSPSGRRANQSRAMTVTVLPTCTWSGWGQRREIRWLIGRSSWYGRYLDIVHLLVEIEAPLDELLAKYSPGQESWDTSYFLMVAQLCYERTAYTSDRNKADWLFCTLNLPSYLCLFRNWLISWFWFSFEFFEMKWDNT